jgi:LPS sulfotransferase NodH
MRRFLILTNGRSGSNFFVQVLNQHPAIANYGEVLGPWTIAGRYVRPRFTGTDGAARFLDWLYASHGAFLAGQCWSYLARAREGRPTHFRQRRAIAALGIKEFTVNFARHGLEDYLAVRPDIALVTLVRENPLERFVSSRTLRETGEVAARTGAPVTAHPSAGIALDVSRLVTDLDVIAAENDAVARLAGAHRGPRFDILYEQFFGGEPAAQQQILADLQQFLGVSPQHLPAEHRRLATRPLAERIANYAAVADALAGTPHARWL